MQSTLDNEWHVESSIEVNYECFLTKRMLNNDDHWDRDPVVVAVIVVLIEIVFVPDLQ
jgi:hypothetical protein